MPSAVNATTSPTTNGEAQKQAMLEENGREDGYTTKQPVKPAGEQVADHVDIFSPGKKRRQKKRRPLAATASVSKRTVESNGINMSCTEESNACSVSSPMQFPKAATPVTGSPVVRPSSLSRAISELKLESKKSSPEGSQSGDGEETSPVRTSLKGPMSGSEVVLSVPLGTSQP